MSSPRIEHIGDATLHTGDALETLRTLPDQSVQTCITSPPYWGLRDYGVDGQLGLETTPEAYVERMVEVFREVRRVLRDDGTLWLNLGDSYANDGKFGGETGGKQAYLDEGSRTRAGREKRITGLKPKDLVGIPWRVSFALQSDGWYLRQDIIWSKPNPMPESVRDRCTKAHEYLFLMAKSERYYYDLEAIKEPVSGTANRRMAQKTPDGWDTSTGDGGHGSFHKDGREKGHKASWNGSEFHTGKTGEHQLGRSSKNRAPGVNPKAVEPDGMTKQNTSFSAACSDLVEDRNRRSVWTVPSAPFKGAHFATFPPDLIRPCVMAGCPSGGVVLDPFSGSGTTGMVALQEGRKYIGIELNPEYQKLSVERITPAAEQPRLIA